jgi:hypothetical protein
MIEPKDAGCWKLAGEDCIISLQEGPEGLVVDFINCRFALMYRTSALLRTSHGSIATPS